MKVSAQELRLHDARTHELGFLAAALGAFVIVAAICNGATPTQDTTEPIWPTKEWQSSSPEEQGMDSKELAKLVDFGTVGVGGSRCCLATWRRLATCTCARVCGKVRNCFRPLGSIR